MFDVPTFNRFKIFTVYCTTVVLDPVFVHMPLLLTDDFKNQPSKGAVCLYTLKNPSHPEYFFETASGVMCVDIHSVYPHLVAVGLHNGSIKVRDGIPRIHYIARLLFHSPTTIQDYR